MENDHQEKSSFPQGSFHPEHIAPSDPPISTISTVHFISDSCPRCGMRVPQPVPQCLGCGFSRISNSFRRHLAPAFDREAPHGMIAVYPAQGVFSFPRAIQRMPQQEGMPPQGRPMPTPQLKFETGLPPPEKPMMQFQFHDVSGVPGGQGRERGPKKTLLWAPRQKEMPRMWRAVWSPGLQL